MYHGQNNAPSYSGFACVCWPFLSSWNPVKLCFCPFLKPFIALLKIISNHDLGGIMLYSFTHQTRFVRPSSLVSETCSSQHSSLTHVHSTMSHLQFQLLTKLCPFGRRFHCEPVCLRSRHIHSAVISCNHGDCDCQVRLGLPLKITGMHPTRVWSVWLVRLKVSA